jgi:hypothetical protein
MAAEVKLDAILEALELTSDSMSSYLDTESGTVVPITEEEFDLAAQAEAGDEDSPDWQREAIALARRIQEEEGKRYLALPDTFDINEWGIMDRFTNTLRDDPLRNDFRSGIRGAGAFRVFKRMLSEHNLWEAWDQFKRAELRQLAIDWCEEHGVAFR